MSLCQGFDILIYLATCSTWPLLPPWASSWAGSSAKYYRLSPRYASMAMPSAFSLPRLSKYVREPLLQRCCGHFVPERVNRTLGMQNAGPVWPKFRRAITSIVGRNSGLHADSDVARSDGDGDCRRIVRHNSFNHRQRRVGDRTRHRPFDRPIGPPAAIRSKPGGCKEPRTSCPVDEIRWTDVDAHHIMNDRPILLVITSGLDVSPKAACPSSSADTAFLFRSPGRRSGTG